METFLRSEDFSAMWKLFYGVETFLRCGDFCTVWRRSVERASYGIRTRFTVGGYVKSCAFNPFGHRVIQSGIN